MGNGSGPRGPRVLVVALFVLLAVSSVILLDHSHQRMRAASEHAIAATDNLMRARLSLLGAQLSWERTTLRDLTFDPLRSLAELDNALIHLSDLLAGRSPLLDLSVEGFEEHGAIRDRIRSIRQEVEFLRSHLVARGGAGFSPIEIRLAFSSMENESAALERDVRERVQERLAREEETHRAFLIGWIAFLVLLAGGAEFLRRARKRAERRLETSEQERASVEQRLGHLRALVDAGVLLVDDSGEVQEMSGWWNRTFGWTEADTVGHPWWLGLHPSEHQRMEDLWRDRAPRGASFSFEARASDRSDGRERWLTALWRPAESGDGQWVGTFVDVTRHRMVEAQFQQAQKLEAIGRMSSGLAHDFNNLLAITVSNVEMLRDSTLDPAERAELLDEITEATASGRELIADLMRFGRRAELEIRPVELSEAVRSAMKLAGKLLPPDVRLSVETPESGPTVHADERALQQILFNLVTNARDAMPDGGPLVVSVDEVEADETFVEERPWIRAGRFGRITVTDAGMGMDRETIEHLFEPFFSTKPEGEGTGLGLASVHGLVRQQGGHVHAYSEPGVGTSLRIYLPVAGSTAEPVDAEEHLEPSGRRVLVVEDDAALRRSTRRVLAELGHQVEAVPDGEEALERIGVRDAAFDLVVSDLLMPGMDGLELARRIRALGFEIPFILTSGRHPSQLEGEPMPPGVHFLPKPWTVEDLRRALRRI